MKFKGLLLILSFLLSICFVFGASSTSTSFHFGGYNYYAYYDLLDNSFAIRFATSDSYANLGIKHYAQNPSLSWISSGSCAASISGSSVSANFASGTYISSDKRLYFLGNVVDVSNQVSNEMLQKNYYMNTAIYYTLSKDGTPIETRSAGSVLVTPEGTSLPSNPFSGSYIDTVSITHGAGTYSVQAQAIPTDPKCDFNSNGVVDESERSSASATVLTHTVSLPDTDNDGFHDGIDTCSTIPGDYGGCPLYTIDNCDRGNMLYSQPAMAVTCSDTDDDDVSYVFGPSRGSGSIISSRGEGDTIYLVNKDPRLTGFATCNERFFDCDWDNFFPDCGWRQEYKGSCQVTYHGNQAPLPKCTIADKEYLDGVSITMYSRDVYKENEIPSGVTRTCSGGSFTGESTYAYTEYTVLPKRYNDLTLSESRVKENDGTTRNKVEMDVRTNKTYFKRTDGTEAEVTLPATPTDRKIIVYKDGINIRNDTIDPKLIAVKGHKIKRFTTDTEAEDFVDDTVRLMKKFDIIKNLTYDSGQGKTKVNIKLQNIPSTDRKNLTIYQVIPKENAENLRQINFISDGGGERIVLDKDPVIGWYFNESEGDEDIEYEIPGENEGGTIIVTQEPILFNEGELVINYREGGCNADEAALFELDDLESSKTYPTGSGRLYTVCMAHLTESLQEGNAGEIELHLFNYGNDGNVSYNNLVSDYSVDVSTDNSSSIYWDQRISSGNPTGNYSCLGSITDEDSSLFGDCGYTSNRIWVHLGEDYYPPTTTVNIPYLAHTIKVELSAEDNVGGSGVRDTYYCVGNDQNCDNFQLYTEPVVVTCPNDWNCIKYMNYYSDDIEGNVEDVKSEMLRMIDKGSACQMDCTAKPTPNRFLKECRNLNGCTYYENNSDEGAGVAAACDYLAQGAFIKLNLTHDVMCPNGPVRESRFTEESLDIAKSWCQNIISTPYTTIFEGETVVMRVLTCQD